MSICNNIVKTIYLVFHSLSRPPKNSICEVLCFILVLPNCLRAATYKLPWDDKSNTPCLTGTHTYISIIKKVDSLL